MGYDKNNDDSYENKSNVDSTEGQKKKLKYPRSIPFIIGNEFCERFNYYGMRTILVLYLSNELLFSKNDATVIFHVFTMCVYFLCIFGAIIADSWLGKFRTILYLSIVYVAGSVLVSLGAIPQLKLPAMEITMVGLALIALGSGGIKPCVAAFGGDQFKLPEQVKQMATFFSLFYFSINSGSLISTTITPILRENVHCFGNQSCYSLAFGVPAVLMCVSVVIFIFGRPLYKSKPPAGNMLLQVTKTISCAIATRFRESKTSPRSHWLDYAERKYDTQLIEDIKVLLRVLVLYIPLPIFWALFDQQGSRWTFQATRMDGVLGDIDIKPDQLQLINPLLILVFIPLYEAAFYPLLAKIGISRPLQKLFCGGLLAGVAFVISGVVELELEKTYPVLPKIWESELRIYNGVPNCKYSFKQSLLPSSQIPEIHIGGMEYYEKKQIDMTVTNALYWNISADKSECPLPFETSGNFSFSKGEAISYFLRNNGSNTLEMYRFVDYVQKPEKSVGIRHLANLPEAKNISWKNGDKELYSKTSANGEIAEIPASKKYEIFVGDTRVLSDVEIKQGAVYTFVISKSGDTYFAKQTEIVTPNSIHILWLIPQYFIMTLGEVMFSVTGLEFSYSQAPSSMKSVLQACWLLTVAIGNAIVVIIAKAKIFESQASEFFLFAALMFIDMVLFAWLAYRYKPNNQKTDSDSEESTLPVEDSTQRSGVIPVNNPAFKKD